MRRRSLLLVLIGLIPLVPIAPLSFGQKANPPARPIVADRKINELLEPLRKKHDVPALAAALVNSKGLVAVGAVGVRKRGDTTAVTVDDQFHLGSDTKAMTAALIARMVEKGELRWSDTLGKTFPKLADKMTPELRKVTLEHLLSHHAGLPANLPGGWGKVPLADSTREQRQVALTMITGEKLESEPGTKFLYSNLGYTIAGHMAEEAGKAPWEELMARRIFEPLGMKSAGHGAMGTKDAITQPWQHTAEGKPVVPGPRSDNPPVMGPAGRVHCSLADWARFVADQIKGERGEKALLQPESYKKLHRPAYPRSNNYSVGGWGASEKNQRAGGLLLAHDGSNTMNHCTAWVAPGRDFAVLVVTNQGGEAGSKACHETLDLMLQTYLKVP
jgi:CubicO group peptidase (beta-lactamase class C family)